MERKSIKSIALVLRLGFVQKRKKTKCINQTKFADLFFCYKR